MKPRIAAITGQARRHRHLYERRVPWSIGRQAGATLKIGNASVSRRHAVIEKEGDRFVIADLGQPQRHLRQRHAGAKT
jgi:pSer/pThr/pTyr-binding forkhead associated (FHA) protein